MHPDTLIGLVIFGPFLFAAGIVCIALDYFNMKGD